MHNVIIVLSNMRKIRKPPNMTKVQSHVTLVLYNVRMVSSNVRKKKKRETSNVTKVQSRVMLVLHNVRMIPSNVRKNKGTTEYDKSIITCEVYTIQCEDNTIKCEEKKIREPLNVIKV